MSVIYLDNAATSFPKPPTVAAAMLQYTQESWHPSIAGSMVPPRRLV